MRPFLKWLGGKHKLVPSIKDVLPQADVLIEPFVGAGSVFLNLEYKKYILNDINEHLINLYKLVQEDPILIIKHSKKLFNEKYNNKDAYYKLREEFNTSNDLLIKSVIFLYLNRHGYNGLTRFNKQGVFNVPFGTYINPYFPEDEILFFAKKAKKVTFTCDDFMHVMHKAKTNSVIYCDPPYVPISASANFTQYACGGFSLEQQEALARLARSTAAKGIPVLISNNNTSLVRKMYKGAELSFCEAQRNISCKSKSRKKHKEVLALFK